jgi:V/A-type H+-transporting ATPase subunit D
MAKLKHTKNELKRQRDGLRRFERFLPTLQLKKQQLQLELRNIEIKIEENKAREGELKENLRSWVALFADDVDFTKYLRLASVRTDTGNVAGVNLPVLEELEFEETLPDLFDTPAWLDDGLATLKELLHLQCERLIFEEQHRLLADELRVTSQRVNLFEKVKIPEAKENIRVIRIFLGDAQTAEIARAKIAKNKPRALVTTE